MQTITSDQVIPLDPSLENGKLVYSQTNDGVKRYKVIDGPYKGAILERNFFDGKAHIIFKQEVKYAQ